MPTRPLLPAVLLLVAAAIPAFCEPDLPHRLPLSGPDWRVFHLYPSEQGWDHWERAFMKDAPLDPLKVWPPPLQAPIPATVPGCVQEDCRRAGLIPDPYVELNSLQAEWTSERDWVYLREFRVPAELAGSRVRLHFEGVDYACRVFLNGRPLGPHQGMYDPFGFDVTDLIKWEGDNRLIVVVMQKPPMEAQIGWTSRVREWKARFAYKWDFCARLVPLGIYDDVWLDFTGPARIDDLWVRPELSEDLTQATLRLEAAVEAASAVEGVSVDAVVFTDARAGGDDGALEVAAGTQEKAALARDVALREGRQVLRYGIPLSGAGLWWPNGHGPQTMHAVALVLRSADGALIDTRIVRFGLRRIRAVANDGAPADALPYVLEVNGKKIYLQGWNWCPADQLYGRADGARYERLLRLARDANCNLLRVWGGGLIEKRVFYDLCDRYGILVWQEFIQSSSGIDNEPSRDAGYLAYLGEQARKIIPRRRNHPSLAIWCGGNELMTPGYKPLTNAHPTNVVFREALAELDPGRIFLPTSPSGPRFDSNPDARKPREQWKDTMHDVHGNWKFEGVEAQYTHYNGIEPLLHSEFGVEGVTNLADAVRIAPKEKLWPPDETNPVWTHHGAWWIQKTVVEGVWGPVTDLETFIRGAQFIQADALRYTVEASRRRQFRTAGTLPWQFNEPWPNLGCTNAVSWFMEPRPAYWWVRKAYAPLHVSLRHDGLAQRGKPAYAAQAWLHNSGEARRGLRIEATIFDVAGKVLHRHAADVDAAANASAAALEVAWTYPDGFRGAFVVALELVAGGARLADNVYLHSTEPDPALQAVRGAPKARVEVHPEAGVVRLRNAGPGWALGVWIDLPGAYLSDNYLFLAPGREAAVAVEGGDAAKAGVTWWNR